MKADYIKNIIESYDKSPYKCILIDGPWGIGKSYAIKEVLDSNNNTCNISMFGIKDAQEIYHEVFFQLVMKDKKGLKKLISKVKNASAAFSNKLSIINTVIKSLVSEKELFINLSKSFNNFHFIVIDDLERMNNRIQLEEVFGIIDELKRCNYVKIILVTNMIQMSQKECFDKYSEKVIDRTYYITERPKKVDWTKLRIHHAFINEFLSKHHVKNLRTLQKAQNLYDDVRTKLKNNYKDEFYDEIRLACYSIVVETIDKLYYKEPDKDPSNTLLGNIQKINNNSERRIVINYLQGVRISTNMIGILQKYYENEIEITTDEIDVEHQIFIHAGEKPNYYKSDNEIKQLLPNLKEKIIQETNITTILRYADEYFIWSEHLQLNINQLKEVYKSRLTMIIYDEVMNGVIEYLTCGIDTFYIQSPTNKTILEDVNKTVKNKVINKYIMYLSENTHSKQAYQYSYTLRNLIDNTFFKDSISSNIDSLYNEKSFPIHNVTDQQYRTAYNIMYVLYHENQDRFLAYCNELITKCDNMSTHRIKVLLEQITERK